MKFMIIISLLFVIQPLYAEETNLGGDLLLNTQSDDSESSAIENKLPALIDLADEYRDADLYYNIGLLSYESNRIAPAVLYLKRAHLIAPRDQEIRALLNEARESAGVPSFIYESSPLAKIFLFPFTLFSLNIMALIGLISFGLGSVLLFLLLAKLARPRKGRGLKLYRGLSIAFLAFGIIYLSASFIRYRFAFDPTQAVISEDLTLRESADAGSDPLKEVYTGMECRVIERDGDSAYIETADGRRGWLENDELMRVW